MHLFATLALAGALLLLPSGAQAQVSDQWASLHPPEVAVAPQGIRVTRIPKLGSGRPVGCPRLWCGCWLKRHYGLKDRKLWRARAWLKVGRRVSGPKVGAVAIYARGRTGGHVGIVTRVIGPGRIVLLSGNDGNRVRERERSTRGVLGYVALR